ncbi:cytochrome-c peroxidase [Pseudoalteromonas sp. S16_S37]|uniref:cytochrome-c peroxidase n=1 Tax=Pseudoalteromonas sp. S16_S37 TaxID=2720228 RepID=UPI0016814543|nr:cytochrome c peroxidase [Pseudoalteromonas sp. S16_S37]MBD1581149.1 cytochrome C peroxidase [Pseudoalteromonas sp. S16_S37]
MIKITRRIALLVSLCVFTHHALAIEASAKTTNNNENLDEKLAQLIAQHELTGDLTTGANIPAVDDPEVKLGKLLFFSKALSGNKDVACASCHHPYLGGGDALALPVGTLAKDANVIGPGRETITGQFYVPRNSPTLFNVWTEKRSLFRDARVEFLDWLAPEKGISTPDVPYGEADPNAGSSLLAAQSRFPVITKGEMRGFDFMPEQSNEAVRAHLAARIGDYGSAQGELFKNNWRALFEKVYGNNDAEEVVTYSNIMKAIAAYQKSMNFTNNPWFRYVRGDKSAITASQKRGAYLYLFLPPPPSDGGTPPDFIPTQCIGCHNTDSFTQTKVSNYHRLAFPQIGPGTGAGDTQTNDLGRMHRNGSVDDIYSFRSGTLLNIEVTAPYGHAGNYDTLEQVMDHYNDYRATLRDYFDNKRWCEQAQFKERADCQALFSDAEINTEKSAKIVDDEIADGAPVLVPLGLDEQELTDIVNFMKALTDPCVKDAACLQAWLPQPEEGDPDGLQLRAINDLGVPLYLPANCKDGDTASSGDTLKLDQGTCISGRMQRFKVQVEHDNSILYFSTRDAQATTRLLYNRDHWADPINAKVRSKTVKNEQVLSVTVNKGTHYVSVIDAKPYQGVMVAASFDSAQREGTEQPKPIANQCLHAPSVQYGQLFDEQPVCVGSGEANFYIKVTEPNSQIEIRTQHGIGNSDVFTGQFWPTRHFHEFASQQNGNNEYLRLDGLAPGWYFISVLGDGSNQGATIEVDIK